MTKTELIGLLRSNVLTLLWLVSPILPFLVSRYVYFTPESKLESLKYISIFGFYVLWVAIILPLRTLFRKSWGILIFVTCGIIIVIFCWFGTIVISILPGDCENIATSETHIRYKCYVGDGEYGYFEAEKGSIIMSFVGMEGMRDRE